MNTLGTKPTIKVVMEESYALAVGFVAASDLTRGQVVKLKTDGTVDKIAALTDMPIGVVTVAAKTGERATVQTSFAAIVKGEASGSVTTSNALAVESFNVTNKRDEYKVAIATNVVSAIALSDAADGVELEVGILRTPFIKA